jgi:mRNA interferase MazF
MKPMNSNVRSLEITERSIVRGDLYYADLSPVVGSEQGGIRPVLIVQNNTGNRFSPTLIVAAITSKADSKANLPTHILLHAVHGLERDSLVLLEQVRTIDRRRIREYIGTLDEENMERINQALTISFGL